MARGYTSDQFLRLAYSFDVTGKFKPTGANTLTLIFPPFNDTRNVEERWAACSGGWDSAPYSKTCATKSCGRQGTFDHGTLTKAIWKDVYIVGSAAGSATIGHIMSPRVFYYKGSYPTAPLADDKHGDFSVSVAVVHLSAPDATSGVLAVTASLRLVVGPGWSGSGARSSRQVMLPAGGIHRYPRADRRR